MAPSQNPHKKNRSISLTLSSFLICFRKGASSATLSGYTVTIRFSRTQLRNSLQEDELFGILGLGRRWTRTGGSDEGLTLFDISSHRAKFYLIPLEVMVLGGIGLSLARLVQFETTHQETISCLDSLVFLVGELADYMNSYVSGALLICGAIEGAIVGLTSELIRQRRREAVQEERKRWGIPCPVFGTQAFMIPTTRPAAVYGIDSPDAGGRYEVTLQLMVLLESGQVRFSAEDREAIRKWLDDKRGEELEIPVLTWDEVQSHHWGTQGNGTSP